MSSSSSQPNTGVEAHGPRSVVVSGDVQGGISFGKGRIVVGGKVIKGDKKR